MIFGGRFSSIFFFKCYLNWENVIIHDAFVGLLILWAGGLDEILLKETLLTKEYYN